MIIVYNYVKKQYEDNKFISLDNFDSYIANKANYDNCINTRVITEVARQLGADEIARGCQLDDILCSALNFAFDDCLFDVVPYRAVTLNVRYGNKTLLQVHERAHFPEDFDVHEYVTKIRERLNDNRAADKYHIVAVPMGIADPWDFFGIVIPEPVLYNHMHVLKQNFWRQLAQLQNEEVNKVLTNNRQLAQIMQTNHWGP